jgi:hypothetical protein
LKRTTKRWFSGLLDEGVGWRPTVVGLVVFAVIVRLLIIAHSHGGNDLRIYVYFSHLPLHGVNPFASPSNGLFAPVFGNSPPLEVAFFTGLLEIHNSPTTLRLVFVLADALTLLLIGLRFPRSRRWKLGLILFYGFNPYVLISFTTFAEDKTILFLGIACWILALEKDREWGSWIAAAALTVFKFLGSFAAPALALASWRRHGRRALIPISAFVVIVLLGSLPWFPKSLDAFSRRDQRLGLNPPIHASPTLLLARLGIYAPVEARLALIVSIILVLALFALRRLEIRETVIWSIFAGYIFLPDNPFSRLLLITLPFLLILELSWRRWLVIWIVSCAEAIGAWVATKGVPHSLSSIAGLLRDVFAHEATVRHVLWMNLLPTLVIGYYLIDRRAGRTPLGSSALGQPDD